MSGQARARSRGTCRRIAASVVLRRRTISRVGSVVRRYTVVGVTCGNTGGSHRFFGTRSRGFGGNIVDLGSWP